MTPRFQMAPGTMLSGLVHVGVRADYYPCISPQFEKNLFFRRPTLIPTHYRTTPWKLMSFNSLSVNKLLYLTSPIAVEH